jgi:hypothetical protein
MLVGWKKSMKIEIHDVGHGGCAVVTCPNGARIMLDCGLDADRQWFPSAAYANQFIDALALQNLDEDPDRFSLQQPEHNAGSACGHEA